MRRIFSTTMLAVALALAGAVATGSNVSKAAHTPARPTSHDAPDDFLLLHEGDYVRVQFRRDAGPGSIRYMSLSDSSRLDILHPVAGVEEYAFRKVHGWQTYPHEVGWQIVTIVLRETGDNVAAGGLPGCSDVVVRVENAAVLSAHHTDTGGPHVRCEVCGATLDW
ncbi:MAG TPA: hypothetical protein VFZ44_14485 [Pyrinomonadaceae bacterium]